MNNIMLITIVSLSLIGAASAIILYFIAQKFKVVEDPRIDDVEEALPSANCGGCGYPGCRAFAEACAKADSLDNLYCPVGGNDVMKTVASILGQEIEEKARQVAVVRCNGTPANRERKNSYDVPQNCSIVHAMYSGETDCSWGCLGLGDCEAACEFDAIHIDPEKGLPVVNEDNCTACGACVEACPKDIIELRTLGKKDRKIFVSCVNKDPAGPAKKACSVACISCGLCEKACKFDAITITNNLSYIDFNKCVLCRACVEVCPTNAIWEVNFPPRKIKPEKKKAEKTNEEPKPIKIVTDSVSATDSDKKEDNTQNNEPTQEG